MTLKDKNLFESYMQYDRRIRQFADTWVDCIEIGIKGGMDIDKSIASAHNLITFGTELTTAALELIILCWEHGDYMAKWYDRITLLVNI